MAIYTCICTVMLCTQGVLLPKIIYHGTPELIHSEFALRIRKLLRGRAQSPTITHTIQIIHSNLISNGASLDFGGNCRAAPPRL